MNALDGLNPRKIIDPVVWHLQEIEVGFLRKRGEWYKTLEYIYNNPKETKIVAKAARVYALKHYIGPEFLKEVEDAYEYFAN